MAIKLPYESRYSWQPEIITSEFQFKGIQAVYMKPFKHNEIPDDYAFLYMEKGLFDTYYPFYKDTLTIGFSGLPMFKAKKTLKRPKGIMGTRSLTLAIEPDPFEDIVIIPDTFDTYKYIIELIHKDAMDSTLKKFKDHTNVKLEMIITEFLEGGN